MDDVKNTQTKPAGLPEKEWFTLDEVAARWGCTVDDLLHYQELGLLKIAALLKYTLRSVERIEDLLGNPGFRNIRRICYPLANFAEQLMHGSSIEFAWAYPAIPEKLMTRPRPSRRQYSEEPFHVYEIRVEDGKNNTDKERFVSVARDDLRITKPERDRFEREHRIGAYAGTMPSMTEKPDRLDPRKETTYLQIIRVLLKELKFTGEKPHSDAEAIQASATAHKAKVPAKTETIAKVITAAMNLPE